MTRFVSGRSGVGAVARLAALGTVVVLSVLVAAPATGSAAARVSGRAKESSRPNVVFILTDDLSWNLVNEQVAPHIVQLERQGETFDHYFVSDSLCCPSRASILTGLFPHDTGVTTNLAPDGGFQKFQSEHLDNRSFAVRLQSAGYATSLLGKYLNGYGDPQMDAATAPIPPGWSDWHVSNFTGYAEFNYQLNDNGVVNTYTGPDDYGVDVLNRDAQAFIAAHAKSPFMVEVSTFAPHAPYTPAPRNADDFPGLTEPRDPSFNTANVDPPSWLANRPTLGAKQVERIDASYRRRAQAVEAVDQLVADTEATLAAQHLADTTYIVFSSDNGYHLGQHRLARGKQTAFDTDIRVPLIVTGPGVPHRRVVHQLAQNVDLAPTFMQLAGARVDGTVEGHSLVPLLHPAEHAPAWRTVGLVEHQGANNVPADPDFEGGGSNPTSYQAIRVSAPQFAGFDGPVDAVFVEYQDSRNETEFYDLRKDPYERRNVVSKLTTAQQHALHATLRRLAQCRSGTTCWRAARPDSHVVQFGAR